MKQAKSPMQQEKLGFVIGNMSHSGGTERVLSILANGLAKRGHRVVIISMWGEKETVFPCADAIKRYRLSKEYPKGIKGNLKNVISLYQIVKKEGITLLIDVDLILTFYSLPLKIAMPGLKRISWEHFNYYYQFRKNNRIRRAAMRLAAAFSDVVLVLSKEDQKYYQDNLKICGRLCQIYNPNTYEEVVVQRPKEKLVFAAGRLTRAKGFDYLLKSWKLLEKDFPEWKLCIAGQGEEEAALLSLKEQLDLKGVEFIGNVEQIEAYYEKAAFFVLPSRNEGFGMVLIEAMAYENPVVSFSCKAGPKDIVTDGKDGFLVKTGDYKSFAARMGRLMENGELRERMGRKAKESTKRFQVEKILDQWEELLGTLK
ncbi:MAG: glycosyltransferase family 4 protein [Lachnospiraceae bacterium]|nr:glycosyltransferase family 4 protein [Lachnospiraceae bacterium]